MLTDTDQFNELDIFRMTLWGEARSDELQVRVYGETAVVIGRWEARGVNAGYAFDYVARYVSVWAWRDSRWQMVSDQSTEIR